MEKRVKTISITSRFPDFYNSDSVETLFYQLADVFGQMLEQAEIDLLKVMRSHYIDTADNEGSQGFVAAQKGDLDKIFALYLEALGGTSQIMQVNANYPNEIEKSYIPYRERLKGLIRVLQNGAATKQGIIDIVAANLGIVGDDQSAREAKEKIQVEEFLPELITQNFKIRPFSEDSNNPESGEPPAEFTVQNDNVIPTTPNIVIRINDNRNHNANTDPKARTQLPSLQPLINPRLVNLTTQQIIQYEGMLKCDDVLRIQSDGTVLLNGIKVDNKGIKIHPLPSGESRWHFEALIGEAKGTFDQTFFDLSRFDRAEEAPRKLNPQQASNYTVDIDIELLKETPGSFSVCVPWDIPGFTDKFDELVDHPRNQISGIIDKVKAAGVSSIITYEKRWQETHDLVALLTVKRSPFTEEHIVEEANFDISNYQSPYPDGIYHEIVDSLVMSGVFDYTSFDTDNRFA